MCLAIDNTASSKFHAVIRFFHTKSMSAVVVHCELCMVYGQNVISEKTVRRWFRMFKDGQTNIHDQ
jgi:hypothetical protein